MRVLALVESPFHLICLNEAIEAMEISFLDVIVVASQQSRNFSQLKAVQECFWRLTSQKVSWHYGDTDKANGKSLYDRISVYGTPFQALRHHSYQRLLISDFRSQWQYDIAATLSETDTWMIDDGTATLSYLHYHVPKGVQFSLPVYGTPERRQEAKDVKRDFGLSTSNAPGLLKLFTMFPQYVPADVPFVYNSLRMVSKTFSSVDEDSAVIVGAKVLERDFCSVQEYHDFIGGIVAACPGKVIYIPHRGQSQRFNDELAAAFPSLSISYIELPLELWLRQQDCPPASIHGFVSTVFYIAAIAFKQLSLYCYAPTETMMAGAEKGGVYGSDCFTNREAVLINYTCLPDTVHLVTQDKEVISHG